MKKIVSLFALCLVSPLIAFAQGGSGGFKYTELKPPQPVMLQSKKIQVIEFFWYRCPHCYDLEPQLEAWVKKLPPDVEFVRIPAVFNDPRWTHDAQVFFTFEALGVLDKVHSSFFDAVHRGGLRPDNDDAMAQWLQKKGIDPKKFNETMKSFTVQTKTNRSRQLSIAYSIDGTPAMAVQGRYTVSVEQGGTWPGMLRTVSYLVEVVRKGNK